MVLRIYQSGAVDRTAGHWRAGRRRVVIVSPTGSGKTTINAELVRRAVANGKRVLILAHRRRLIQQLAERLALFGVRYGVVMADLPDQSWACRDATAAVQIASRDTLLAHAARHGWEAMPHADLLAIDEAHNLEGPKYALLASSCQIRYWVGLTATPCRPDGSGLGRRYWDAIVEAATVEELTRAGHLVPVKAFAPPGIGERRRRGEKTPVAGDPVDHWRRYASDMPTVVFTRTVAESLAVRDRYRAAGIPALHLDANTPYEERERAIEATEAGRNLILTNAAILGEGVDIPAIACVQLLAPFGSYVRYAQAIGRALRPAPGKTHAVLLDHAGAVFQHGLPGDPVTWSLSEDDNLDARLRQERKDGTRAEPVCCPSCGCLFAGSPACPECGTPIPRRTRKEQPVLARERLVQVSGEPGAARDRAQREWANIVYMARAKGWSAAKANAVFKGKHGVYPGRLGLEPAFPFDSRDERVADLLAELRA